MHTDRLGDCHGVSELCIFEGCASEVITPTTRQLCALACCRLCVCGDAVNYTCQLCVLAGCVSVVMRRTTCVLALAGYVSVVM